MHSSIWYKDETLPRRPPLRGRLAVDAAVVGGGMAGLLTAYFLSAAGLRTAVLEASRIGSGQTGRSTAKITSQHGPLYHRLIRQLGMRKALLYAAANEQAVAEYRRLISQNKIDCGFTAAPAYLYSTAEQSSLRQEWAAAKLLGIDARLLNRTELPFPVACALCFPSQAYFNPLRFLSAIAGRLEIYEQTKVLSAKGDCLMTNHGPVKARHIIFACHYPFPNLPGCYFMRMHQERSYVLALENAAPLNGMYLGIDRDGLSFRPCGELLLLGGSGHRTGENSGGGRYRELREAARLYWPGSREAACWSAQDCMTLDGIPYIGRFSSAAPSWYVATGFQKWGMTSSMVAARLISDLILKGQSPWEEVFSPQRPLSAKASGAFWREAAHASKGLARAAFMPPRSALEALPRGTGGIVEYRGKKAGVYREKSGKCFIVSPRCPHLGCQLEWNPDEKSWDCPCHGSRFDFKGNLIDNPAQEDLKSCLKTD